MAKRRRGRTDKQAYLGGMEPPGFDAELDRLGRTWARHKAAEDAAKIQRKAAEDAIDVTLREREIAIYDVAGVKLERTLKEKIAVLIYEPTIPDARAPEPAPDPTPVHPAGVLDL